MASSQKPPGPPYAPQVWLLGGAPKKSVDIPLQSVFMVLFIIGAAIHMTIFQKNRARGHKFIPNVLIFGFCMSRVVTSILRIASVSLPHDVQLAIAAQIFVAAGVLLLFIINLIFAQRVVRSTHRSFGWHPAFSIAFKILWVLIGATLIIVITATVITFYTLNPSTRATTCRALQLYGTTFLAIVATLPLPIVTIALLTPYSPLDRFGTGRLRTKVIALLVSTTLLSLGAWYRCGTTWQTPIPRTQPLPGYLGKAPFYIFNFLVEILTVFMYAILRIDLRWHIPNGAKGPGSYSRSQQNQREGDVEAQNTRQSTSSTRNEVSHQEPATKDAKHELSTLPISSPTTLTDHEIEKSLPTVPPAKLALRRSSTISARLTDLLPSSTPSSRRDSANVRIVQRLGGPWEKIPSPSPTATMFSFTYSATEAAYDRPESGRSSAEPPSLPASWDDGFWTPKIEWQFTNPKRFLSLKKRSMVGLNLPDIRHGQSQSQ